MKNMHKFVPSVNRTPAGFHTRTVGQHITAAPRALANSDQFFAAYLRGKNV